MASTSQNVSFGQPRPQASNMELEFAEEMATSQDLLTCNEQLDEPIPTPSSSERSNPFQISLTKIIGTLGPKSCDVETISSLLKAGMSVARFDFSCGTNSSHLKTLQNLKTAVKKTGKGCAVMLETVGPAELQIINKNSQPILLPFHGRVTLMPAVHAMHGCSSDVLVINPKDPATMETWQTWTEAVKPGNTIVIGEYLLTGNEKKSVVLEVSEVHDTAMTCTAKTAAEITSGLLTARASRAPINRPTLTKSDRKSITTWGVPNGIDFLSLAFTRSAENVREARNFISSSSRRSAQMTKIFAKIDSAEGVRNFDAILLEADGIIVSRGDLGIELDLEEVFVFQKTAIHACNAAGKPVVVTRIVDSMLHSDRPTPAQATDLANAVLDGVDAILLGATTQRGTYPVEAVATVQRICSKAEENSYLIDLSIPRLLGEMTSRTELMAFSAVSLASKVDASAIILLTTSTASVARLVATFKPTVPVLVVFQAPYQLPPIRTCRSSERQCLVMRCFFPVALDPSVTDSEDLLFKTALKYGKVNGIVKPNDEVIVYDTIGHQRFSSMEQIRSFVSD